MPTLLSESVIHLEMDDLQSRSPISRPPSRPRAPGVHQSGILHAIAHRVGWLKSGQWDDTDKGVGGKRRYPWRWALGVMWEEFYFSLITGPDKDVLWQPGERTVDGISVNCDGLGNFDLSPEDCCAAVYETKCTEKKVMTGEEFLRENLYMHQGRSYLHVYGPRVVVWVVCYYRGDWRGSGPVVMMYVVEFTDKEVRDTWEMLKANIEFAEVE